VLFIFFPQTVDNSAELINQAMTSIANRTSAADNFIKQGNLGNNENYNKSKNRDYKENEKSLKSL
jgi:surface antigen